MDNFIGEKGTSQIGDLGTFNFGLDTAQPFQIVLLKGDAGFGTNSHGIVHRSPIVPASIEGRWYLRVDPLSTTRSALHGWARL